MITTDYEKLLSALTLATRVLESNQGDLSAADVRIRCLVNITTKEAKRALLEASRPVMGGAKRPGSLAEATPAASFPASAP